MADLRTIEIDGTLVGILTKDRGDRDYHFHSGVAPFDLLDGSRFRGRCEAMEAIGRMGRAARKVRRSASVTTGDYR
ncbi:MAG: hypothetical protein JSS20_02890 [Proteobacteria bacterium]|nr:hypothetical protein [Pseudomonadota bacterium]